jgi:hypothetical protein
MLYEFEWIRRAYLIHNNDLNGWSSATGGWWGICLMVHSHIAHGDTLDGMQAGYHNERSGNLLFNLWKIMEEWWIGPCRLVSQERTEKEGKERRQEGVHCSHAFVGQGPLGGGHQAWWASCRLLDHQVHQWSFCEIWVCNLVLILFSLSLCCCLPLPPVLVLLLAQIETI